MRWQQPPALPRQVSGAATRGRRGMAGAGGRSGGGRAHLTPTPQTLRASRGARGCARTPGERWRAWRRVTGTRGQGVTHHPALPAGGTGWWVAPGVTRARWGAWIWASSHGTDPLSSALHTYVCTHVCPPRSPPPRVRTREPTRSPTTPPANGSAAGAHGPPRAPDATRTVPGEKPRWEIGGVEVTSRRWWGPPPQLPRAPSLTSLLRLQERSAGGVRGRGPLPPVSFPLSSYA